MHITIVSATNMEIQATLEQINNWNRLKNHTVEHVETGIGLVSTSYSLTKHLQKNRPDLMIQAGIAGCFDQSVPLGSTFFITEDCIGDMGVYENSEWKDAQSLGFIQSNVYPWQNGYLKNRWKDYFSQLSIKHATAISVNEISTDPQFILSMKKKHNPLIESMEGAAFHYTCLKEQIPFVQLRSVSNYVGERDKSKWQLKESIKNLNHLLIDYVNHIINYHS